MKIVHAEYNPCCNSIDITHYDGYMLRIDIDKAEEGLRTTLGSQCALDALAMGEPLEYARIVLDNEMQIWVDAEDGLV